MTSERPKSIVDIQYEESANRFRLALLNLERHFNPNWALQARLPRGLGQRISGTWTDGDGVVIPAGLGIITQLGREAVRFAVRRALPYLRKPPRRWSGRAPNENEFDESGRVAPPTPRRPEHPFIWFHSDSELKRHFGPAGDGRSWHHIVEQRLADNGRFPPEWIHNTDNVISIPDVVHYCINAEMSRLKRHSGGLTVRQWLEPKSFEFQYNYGLKLFKRCAERIAS
jgi:hypothetical protein